MPKVIQYQPNQVETQVVKGPRAQSLPSGAFSTGLEGLADIGKGLADLGERIDTTEAEEALVQFEKQKNDVFFNPESGYFNTQGRNAYDGAAGVRSSMADLKKQFMDSLGSEGARQKFSRAADAHIIRADTDIMRHASKGMKAWEVATIDASVENTIENASLYWNDNERLKTQMVLGEQSVLDSAKLSGEPPEATNEKLQTYRSSFAKSAVEAATVSSAADGKEVFDRYENLLEGPDKVKLQKTIEAQEKSEKTQAHATYAVTTASDLVNKYDDVSGALNDMSVESLKESDPQLYKTTRAEVKAQFSLKKYEQQQQEQDSYERSIDYVNEGRSQQWIEVNDPDAWSGMTSLQRNNILSGKHMITNQVTLTNLLTLPKTELAKVNPLDHAADLKPSDLGKLTTAVNAANKGQSVSRVQSLASKSKNAAEGVFGKQTKWRNSKGRLTEKGKRASEFMTTLQDAIEQAETEKGSSLLPSEENKIINDYSREITIQRSAFTFDFLAPDTVLSLRDTPPEDMRLLNQVIENSADLSPGDLVDAYQLLVDNGTPVNAMTLRQAYEQGTQ